VDAWQRHRFFEGLARALLGSDRPTLLMLDNLQWSDEETLSFLAFLLRLGHDRPLMLLATVRDGYPAAVADWLAQLRSAGTIGASISLEPLGRADCAALVRALAGRQADPATVEALVSVAGGFPLYVREAVRSGLESADAAAGWNDLLAMRLDQLSETGQQVAALTAAAGRAVTLDLLTVAAALDAGPDAEAVVRAVDELWHAGILTANGTGYDFSHDLLRDAAYDAVTPARRWLLHDRLARALEALGSDAPDVAAQLAEQYARGGRPERALPHFARAIAGATDRFAHTEAIRLCRRALDLVATLPAGPTRDASELSFLRVQAAPLNAVEGYSSPALEQVLERVVRLAESARDDTSLAEGLMGLWACRFVQGQVERSFGLAHRLLELGVGDPALTAEAHFATAGSAMTLGQLRTSLAHFDKARRDPAEDDWLLVGTKPEWHRMAWSAHALLLSGDPIGAEKARSTAIEQSAAVGHPYTLAVTYGYAAVTDQLRGDRAALAASVRALLELTERYHFAYYHEWGQLLHGWLVGGADGLAEARRGLETLRRHGALVRMPYWLSLVADLHLAAGRRDAAAAALDAARSYALGRGDRWWLPEVLRRLGRLRADDETYAAGRALADEQGNRLSLDRYAGDELVER
jgi:tetratricopeptide (TPR) repeat protein